MCVCVFSFGVGKRFVMLSFIALASKAIIVEDMNNRCCLLIQIARCFEKSPLLSFCGFCGAYIRGLSHLTMKKLKDKCKAVFHSRGCLGCFSKPPLIITAEEPSNGLKHQGVKKPSFTEDFWSTSTGDMDNSAIQSQRSISSISTSNPTLDPHFSSGSKPTEFVNHGLLLWNQTRQQWIGNKGSYNHTQAREPRLSWNATYESLLGTSKPFPQRMPLPEMVNFLVDIWEQEGLYD